MVTTIDVLDAASATRTIATNDALALLLGEVSASPTANTVLERLQALQTLLSLDTAAGATTAVTQRVVLSTNTTVPNVTGNVASAAADSGNPVKVGGVYTASLPTLTDGNRGNVQLDVNGAQLVNTGQLALTKDAVQNSAAWGVITNGSGTSYTVKRARATLTAAAAADIVAAVTNKQIQVIGYSLQSQGSNTPSFNFVDDAGSPVTLSRTWLLDKTGAVGPAGVVCSPTPYGCGVDPTTTSKKLRGILDTTGSVVVEVSYIEL